MSQSIIAFAESLYAALDDEDIEPFVDLCAVDVVIRYPAAGLLPYGGTWHGHDGVRSFLGTHDEAEEILKFEPSHMVADGDRVFVLGTFEGRVKPSGNVWSTEFVHVLHVVSGRLLRWDGYFDTAAAMRAHAAD
jgi:ketosteroid isomerase-like protein